MEHSVILEKRSRQISERFYIENTDTEAVEGKDYQLEYSNNINEGTATVKVVGIGDAKGTVLTYTYHIEKTAWLEWIQCDRTQRWR